MSLAIAVGPWPLALGVLCFLAGLGVGLAIAGGRARRTAAILREGERQRQAETEALLDGVKSAFADIAFDVSRRSGEDLVRVAQVQLAGERRSQGQQLAAERAEFEARIGAVLGQLERMQALIRELERDRSAKFGELGAQLHAAGERAQTLATTTQKLAHALVNPRARGQWGERLAEDVLRLMGLVENVSYRRQVAIAGGAARPDFTLLLPEGRLLHMDVKFPFENWLKSLEATDEEARRRAETAFVRDVRGRIAEVAGRGYVDPAAGTLDLALLFVPNERVFGGILDLAPDLVDEALRRRVVLVSPGTLFAVLAVVREAMSVFRLGRTTRELAQRITAFRGAWTDEVEAMRRLGQRHDELTRDYQAMLGSRRRRLEREVDALAALLDGGPATPSSGDFRKVGDDVAARDQQADSPVRPEGEKVQEDDRPRKAEGDDMT